MAALVTKDDDNKITFIHPKNLVNGLSRLFGSDPKDDADGKSNIQGEIFWMTLAGYILGNSLGTNNTLKGNSRLHLGPVYIW